jgi:nucleoside-diphosphate-sugar epimerase
MQILVTGASGRVGSHLTPRLIQSQDTIRVLVRQEDQAERFRQMGAEAVVGDLLKPESLARAVGDVDIVVHLAAFFRGATEAQTEAVNLDGTTALLHAVQEAGVQRLIFSSTCLVYGPGRGRPAREDDEPVGPLENAYPRSKLAAERLLLRDTAAQSPGLTILRLAFVYGEGDPHLAEGVRFATARPAQAKLHMVHHADVGQAVQLALRNPDAVGKIYNVADEQPVTYTEILELNGKPVPEANRNMPVENPWEGISDITCIQKELGFHPIYPSVYAARDAGAL